MRELHLELIIFSDDGRKNWSVNEVFDLVHDLDERGKVRAQIGEALTRLLKEVDESEKERNIWKALASGPEVDASRGS